MKTIKILIASLALSVLCIQPAAADQTEAVNMKEETVSVSYPINWSHEDTLKYGRVILDCSASDFLKDFDYGDYVYVEFPGRDRIIMPICADYDDVAVGEYLIRIKKGGDTVALAINYGVSGEELGYLKKTEDAYQSAVDEEDLPAQVVITMAEKGGYKLRLSELNMSTDRAVYSDLSDEEFCNFRNICVGAIKPGKIYRSSSPIAPSFGRNKYADGLMKKYGIRTVINIADSEEEANEYPDYEDSNYSASKIHFEKMGLFIRTEDFRRTIAECLRIIADSDAPCLIHCIYGKDRTGILCALIEGLCDANLDEIKEDYVLSFDNLYTVEDGKHVPLDEDLRELIRSNLVKTLSYAFGTEINEDNIDEETEKYVKSIGLTDQEIERIRERLQ